MARFDEGKRDGAFSRDREDAVWQQVFTAQPEQRRTFEPKYEAAEASTGALAVRYALPLQDSRQMARRLITADGATPASHHRSH
jgi:hypothetical protein